MRRFQTSAAWSLTITRRWWLSENVMLRLGTFNLLSPWTLFDSFLSTSIWNTVMVNIFGSWLLLAHKLEAFRIHLILFRLDYIQILGGPDLFRYETLGKTFTRPSPLVISLTGSQLPQDITINGSTYNNTKLRLDYRSCSHNLFLFGSTYHWKRIYAELLWL